MDSSPPRRHFKSVFPNHSGYPGLSAALEVSAIFRYYDGFRRQFICTLKEDEALYDALQQQMNEFYSSELACTVAPRLKRHGVYAASVDGHWKRVRVDRIDYDTRQCSVETVDDGQLLTIGTNKLYVLDPAFITNQYMRTFAVHFVMPRKPKRNCLAAAGFADGHGLHNGQFVNVFIFSDREPFLALLTEAFMRIQVEKLVDDMDPGSARLWSLTLSGESGRCRGVAFGSYTLASLPSDVWCDVTVAAFESLEDVQVRGPEQSIRLMYLEQFMETVYGDEEFRDRLTFETGVHVSEGLACVAWDSKNQRWVRARITCASGDRSVVDALAVDYPSITLRDLKFRDGEIFMLRTDLLFPPLCCSIRAIDASDKLETFTKSAVAKEVLQIGIHIRVYSPASSTLSVIELSNGLKLGEYIAHAVEVDSVRCSGLGQSFSDTLDPVDVGLGRIYTAGGRGSHNDATSFSSSMNSFPRAVLVPQEHYLEPFSQSLSLGSQRRSLPLRCGISAFQTSKRRSAGMFQSSLSNRLATIPPSPVMPTLRSPLQFKTPTTFPRSSVDALQTPLKENPFRKPFPVYKRQRKPSAASSSPTNFENDYLNKSLTSCDSDSDGETFGKSVRQKQQQQQPKGSSINVTLPSPPLYNSDSYSENSDLFRREKPVPVEVLNINCATEIFLSTTETKEQYDKLEKALSFVEPSDLLSVSGSWCIQNEHYLYRFDGSFWRRVKILSRDFDDWKLLCIDTGEERFVSYESRFYRLPSSFTISEWPPACLGPLRLSGPMDARWLSVAARVHLRGLCKKALSLTASFGKGESDRSVVLYDEKKRCLNDQFMEFIKKEGLAN